MTAILLTHGHDDHITARPTSRGPVRTGLFHPDDLMLWESDPDAALDRELHDGPAIEVAGTTLTALHTPGHTPGGTCLLRPDLGTVFTGDTLFGGPGGTGRSYSDGRLHPGVHRCPAADPTRRHRRPHRARRRHDHRGGGGDIA